ncbi:MAG: efflux RND transporter periplasmic adaptor subunit, partial [Bacteroidia bacterium]|nr:efflux RND transporter periplasmic adaptor subunit [Bacteroidia bacterium]
MKKINIVVIIAFALGSCNKNKNPFDASGTFETVEIIISAEATGTIKQLNLEEGQQLKAGEVIGYIDSVQLYLKKKQLQAQIIATLSMKPDVGKQTAALKVQLKAAEAEQKRVANLLKADAATPKQSDDVNAQIEVIKKQIEAQQSSLSINNESIIRQTSPLEVQIEQLNDQLAKCIITNRVNGTVINKYAEPNELAVNGKALYKIANLSTLLLRVYLTGDQFAGVRLNQVVTVTINETEGKLKEYKGIVEWISNKAEFTPKTIQTKEERANLVYAVKIRV